MVPREQLSRIQGLNQVLNGGMTIAAAPLGALLVAVLPMHAVLSVDVLSALCAVLPLFFVAVPQPQRSQREGARPTVWQDFISGLRYIWGWPGLVMILGMATLINLVLNPAFMLLPLLVTRHFGGEALHLAWIQSASGVGVIAGGLLLSVWGGFRRRILTSLLGILVLAGASIVMGLLPASGFMAAVGVMFVLGLSNPIINGPLFAALQACVEPDMQGRVFTVIISVATAMTPLGMLAAGPVADYLGVQVWFLAGGIISGGLAVGSYFIPALIDFDKGRYREPERGKGLVQPAVPGD
jgi:MFS transporter, DHA3 family, macrolide efflux protein